jgi:hypothetical protein
MRIAETNTAILSQMKAEQPTVSSNATIVLRYMQADPVYRFPDSFQDWTFLSAVQLLYANLTRSCYTLQIVWPLLCGVLFGELAMRP